MPVVQTSIPHARRHLLVEETDLFKAWLPRRVRDVRSQLKVDHGALLDEELVTVDAAAILGLEKYLSREITKE
eukprot:scaffold9780_cov80-Skeletonema_menzelii.AAC.5